MKSIQILSALLLTIPLSVSAQINYHYSNNFSASCDFTDNTLSATTLHIYLLQDSIIIEDRFYSQCCPSFALKISEVKHDSAFVSFSDTSTIICDCDCEIEARINAGKAGSENIRINYNGSWYSILPHDYKPLLEFNKKWTALEIIPGIEDTGPTVIEQAIESKASRSLCWNGKKYYEVKPNYTRSNGPVYPSDTISNFIREENGRIYYLDPNPKSLHACEEALLYDFSLSIGDTVTVGLDSIKYIVVPAELTELEGRRVTALADLSHPEMSNHVLWIEGIGDTRGLFKSARTLYIDGVFNVLTCCSVNENLIYQDKDYPNCGTVAALNLSASKQVFFYPNPARDKISFEGDLNNQMSYQITNTLGAVVVAGKLLKEIRLDLKEGFYLLVIKENNSIIKSEKLIIEQP